LSRAFFNPGRAFAKRDDAAQLKETTMDPMKRTMLRIELMTDEKATTAKVVERLMGNKSEERFKFISEKAEFVSEEGLDI
jgi:topoisomerase-4 subunit B